MLLKTIVTAALAMATVAPPHAQTPAQPAGGNVLALARSGKPDDAWKMWETLPRTDDNLRTGVRLAVLTKKFSRGVELYADLARQTQAPDRPVLTELAVGAAIDLATSVDPDLRVGACSAVLVLQPTEATCRKALETMAEENPEADQRALAAYALANASVRPWEERAQLYVSQISKSTRMQLARRMTHLKPVDRLMLIQSLLDDRDVSTQYEAVLVATEIPGDDVLAALRNVQASPLVNPAKTAVMLAIARHGDTSDLDVIAQQLPNLGGFDRITAARVLGTAGDKRGIDVLLEMLQSRVDYERVMAAEAIGRINPFDAQRVILELVQTGSAAIKPSAILAAGSLGLGTEPEIYKRLADAAPYRAAVVEAIATTFSLQDSRRPARGL